MSDLFTAAAQALPLLRGNTYPHRAALAGMGGKWDAGAAGWRIPADRLQEAQALLTSTEETMPEIGAEQVQAILDCLRLLRGHCDGARTLDGAGFSKLDAAFGHSLAANTTLTCRQAQAAAKMLRKYRRQLPAALLARATNLEGTGP